MHVPIQACQLPDIEPTTQSADLNHSGQWGLSSLYRSDAPLRGAASCATASCHGGPVPGILNQQAPRGSEHALWIEKDPHARSWQTLCSDDSLRIMDRLGILRGGKIIDPKGYENCLACHNTDRQLEAGKLTPRQMEGVGCEACHGPSNQWIDNHFQNEQAIQIARKQHGLVDLALWIPRAKSCTLCHVGGSDRDMNHDVIAAGHPALYFDMAVYYEAYPKHWRDTQLDAKEMRAKLWLAGQIASADSELELIVSRATQSNPVSVWPELSNYSCTSCHATLDGNMQTDLKLQRKISAGDTRLREWNLKGLEALRFFPNTTDKFETTRNTLLNKLLNPLDQPSSISLTATMLRNQIQSIAGNSDHHDLLFWSGKAQSSVAANQINQTAESDSWELAAATYIATWAALPYRHDPSSGDSMRNERQNLLFPINTQSPIPAPHVKRSPPVILELGIQSLRDATLELLQK